MHTSEFLPLIVEQLEQHSINMTQQHSALSSSFLEAIRNGETFFFALSESMYNPRDMMKFAIFAGFLIVASTSDELSFKTIFEWKYINYSWPSAEALTQAVNCGKYIPENNPLLGIKIWKDKMYLAIPRNKNGVPVTLAVISSTPQNGVTDPLLDPYPNWNMQTEGDCNAFQFVQSMEIDPLGRMWVIDSGRTQTSNEEPIRKCPPRLVILDLENNGSILHNYVFPDGVARYNTVGLNDIAVDHEDGGTAFITDSQNADPGIIVYSLKDNVSWKVRNNATMTAQADAQDFIVAGTRVSANSGVNGITLSPPGPNRLLYYSSVPSFHVYSIQVSVLKNPYLKNIDEYITDVGLKPSQSGGMVMSNKGVLYFGVFNDDAIAMWDSKLSSSITNNSKKIFRDHVTTQWPDTFAFDGNCQLSYVTNRLQKFLAGTTDITEMNYRILIGTVRAKSYQYLPDGTAPKLPVITAASDRQGNFKRCTI